MLSCKAEGSARAVAILLSGRLLAASPADAWSAGVADLQAEAANASEFLEAVARGSALLSNTRAPDTVVTDGTAVPRVRGNQVAKLAPRRKTDFAARGRGTGATGERIAALPSKGTRVVGRIAY